MAGTDASVPAGSMTSVAPRSWKPLQIRIVLLVFLLFLVDGLDAQMLVLAVPALSKSWGLAAEGFRLPISIGYLGVALGASIGGLLSDRFGRRPVIIWLALLFGPATLAMAFTTGPDQMIALRFVAGIGLGGCMPPALTLLTETVQPSRRALVVSIVMLSAPFGSSVAGVITAIVIPHWGWPAIFWAGGGVALAMAFILHLFLPESPSFLARRSDQRHRMAILVEKLGIDAPAESSAAERDRAEPSARQLLSPDVRHVAAGMTGAFLFVYVAGGIVLGWLPAFLTGQGFSMEAASLAMSTWSLAGIAGSLAIGWVTTRISAWRAVKIVPIISIIAALALAVALAVPGAPVQTLVYPLLAVAGALSSALVILLYACAAQAFPAYLRASGIGICATAGKIGGFAGSFGGASLIALAGGGFYFVVYSAAVVAVLVTILHARRHMATDN